MHLRSNESSGLNLSSAETSNMGSSSSSLFRLGSVNRAPPDPVLNSRLRDFNNNNLETGSINPPTNSWTLYEDERETLPSLFQTNSSRPSSRDRTQLPSLSHAIHPRNGFQVPPAHQDPVAPSSRTNPVARPDPLSLSSRRNPAPLRSSDWFQDMHELFHPYTPFSFDDHNSSADSGRESPLSISDIAQSRQSPETETGDTSSSSYQMEGVEQTLPFLSSLQNRSSAALPLENPVQLSTRPEEIIVGNGRTEPVVVDTFSLRRSANERNGTRNASPVPWRNFLAGLDSRESSLENLTSSSSNVVPERQQVANQGQSTSLVGTLRDLLHRSTTTQGDPAPANRRSILRNPFRSSENARPTSADTEERISGLIDDDYPVLLMPPGSAAAPVTRPSRSLLDPALRFDSARSGAPPSVEPVRPPASRLRRSLRISWAMDDEHPSQEPEPFIPEPVRNERIEPPRPRSITSIFGNPPHFIDLNYITHFETGLNRSSTTAGSSLSSTNRVETSWPQVSRNVSGSRSPVHSARMFSSLYLEICSLWAFQSIFPVDTLEDPLHLLLETDWPKAMINHLL